MFEVFEGKPRQAVTATPVIISIVGHVLLVGPRGGDSAAVRDGQPAEGAGDDGLRRLDAERPHRRRPPPPPPTARPRTQAQPKQLPANAYAAPVEAPSEIRPELPGIAAVGRVGGVEGGVVGGVAGGIVGGLVAAPPPPPPPPPPPAPPKGPVRIGGNIQAPALVKRVEPTYPDIALVAKVTGLVILEATVGADGSVESVRVLRSVKFLDQAAIDAVKQWKYSPLVLNGVPSPFVLSVTLNFSVKES